jgi:hypothetical protein
MLDREGNLHRVEIVPASGQRIDGVHGKRIFYKNTGDRDHQTGGS